MPAPLYSLVTGGAVALTAATAKCVLGVKAHASSGLLLKKARVSFDGITSTAVPVLVELCYSTFATNSPGTASTSLSAPAITQVSGRSLTAGFTAAKTWTTEPTVLTVLSELLIHPQAGLMWLDIPLGDEWDTALGEGFAIRLTAPAIVNARAEMQVARC